MAGDAVPEIFCSPVLNIFVGKDERPGFCYVEIDIGFIGIYTVYLIPVKAGFFCLAADMDRIRSNMDSIGQAWGGKLILLYLVF